MNIFQNNILKLIPPKLTSITDCHNPKGTALKTVLHIP